MDVDALDAAAALAGIEEGAVDQILDREFQVGVGRHVGRVLAAEFEAEGGERSRRRPLHAPPAFDRTGEGDMVDVAAGDDRLRLVVLEHDVSQQTLRQADPIERLLEAIADEQGLRRLLQQHGVAGDQRRHDGIDGRQDRDSSTARW